MPLSKINITQDMKHPVPQNVLAQVICKLSDSSNELLNSGLNEKAIITLLADSSKISKRTIKKVLDAMGQLRADYTHE